MNCVVFGGGGFIGSHLSEALLNQNNKVTVFEKPGAPYLDLLKKKGAAIVLGNFLEPSDVKNALIGAETIYHLISTTVPKSSNDNPVFDVETNLIGTINLLKSAKNEGVKKIVIASSGGTVYGIPQVIPISEDHPTNPISSYGIIKLAIEKYTHLFWKLYGLDYCILRVSNAFGERQGANEAQGVIPNIINNALHHQIVRIWGDGSVIRDYIHVSDVVNAFLKAGKIEGDQRVFNIGSGIGFSVIDIVRTIEEFFDEPLSLVNDPGRAYDVPINILDNRLAKQVLQWEPKINLSTGIFQTLNFMRNHMEKSKAQ